MEQKSYQRRLINEKLELDIKRRKLGEFKNTDDFLKLPWEEQERLNTQAHIMTMYSAILSERLAVLEEFDYSEEKPNKNIQAPPIEYAKLPT